MPNYLVTIYRDESTFTQQQGTAVSAPYRAFMQRHAGSLRGGAGLEPASTATSIRSDGNGGYAVTDGPFAESKEVLGGYYVIEAADLDEALAIAKEVPAPFGGVEVRPIRVLS
ncbi:YciI family protein [Microbacterium deminutum]|uniref:YciI family protein n=1 Tax=Microbacterium deminutum TaxID=344164 RepID=A0ABN2Q6I8_9MICO